MQIFLSIDGDVQLNRELLRVGQNAGDLKPAFEVISRLWIGETKAQFATQGAHASGGWKPLKPSTVLAKRRKHLRPEILRATDALLRSLTVKGDPNMVLKIGETELDYSSKVPYVGAHQNPRPGSRLPQRRPVEFTETARRNTVKVLQRWIFTGELD